MVVIMTIIVSLCGAIQPLWLSLLVAAILDSDRHAVLVIAGVMGLTTTTFVVFDWARFHASQSLQERTNLYLDAQMARMSLELPGLEHHERPSYQDRMALLREQRIFLSQSLMSTLLGLNLAVRAAVVIGLLASVHPLLMLLSACGIGLVTCTRKADQLREKSLATTAHVSRQTVHLFDLATSAKTAKELHIFGLGDELLNRHDRFSNAIDAARLKAMLRAAGIQSLGWLGFVIGYVTVIAFVAWLAIHGRATTDEMVMTLGLATQVYGLLQGGLAMFAWLLLSLGAMRHYLWLSAYAIPAQDPAKGFPRHVPVPVRLRHGIDFENVSFRYPDTNHDVLADVTLHLPAGATVAVVGDNGAGKSTLVKLLSRFYEPTAGRILVDGIEVRDFDIEEWRSRLSAAFQDFARFEFVTQEPVGVGDLRHIEDPLAVERALGRAGADDLLATLPRGAET
jgi:ATP-binding cassette subfamily B protein